MIIVGVDYSIGSSAAAGVAMQLAADRGEASRFIHVAGSRAFDEGRPEGAEDWLSSLGLEEDDIQIRRGVPWIELVRAADESATSFLVVGTHGRSGFQPLRLGRTAELLALRARTPIVLVPSMHPAAQPAGPFNFGFSKEEH